MVFLLRRIRYSRRGPPGVCWRGREWGGIGLSVTISRVTTTRGGGCPCCAVRTHARRHGDGPAASGRWSSCWLLRGSRPWSGTHECACLRLCRGPRAARSSGVSRLLVFSAPRRRASPPSRPDAVAGRPVWRFVTHAGRPMPVSPSVSASGTSFSFRADGETLSQPLNLINTDPVRPVQPSVQYF